MSAPAPERPTGTAWANHYVACQARECTWISTPESTEEAARAKHHLHVLVVHPEHSR